MHNIDRTLQELEAPLAGEFENEFEYSPQGEQGYGPASYETQAEQQELEMAYQLLEVSNEQELNMFLGDLIGKATDAVSGAASRFVSSPAGQSVGQYLVDFGKKTLPQLGAQYGGQAGAALGSRVGTAVGSRLGSAGARAGGWLGQQAGSWAGQKAGGWAGTQAGDWLAGNAQRIFGLELESMSPESQELEIARSFVRFATDVSRRANQIMRRNPGISLGDLGRQVIGAAAAQHAPGLLAAAGPAGPQNGYGPARAANNSGTWVRRGSTLVLYDA